MVKFRFFMAMLAVMLAFGLAFTGCESGAANNGENDPLAGRVIDDDGSFNAKILEISDTYVIVEPLEGEDILRSSNRITFLTWNLNKIDVSVWDVVTIRYEGGVRESYPAQITATSWSKLQ